MLSLRWKVGALLALLLTGAAWGQVTYNCLPTCDSTDARFLAIANGAGFVTLSQPTLDLELAVPKGTTSFTVGVFDGDARGTDSSGASHWDQGSPAVFSYTLYDDPNRDHAAATVVPMSGLPSQLSTAMPDNAWIDFTVNTDPGAQAPSGNYFYLLRIQLTTTTVAMTNAFKIRTSGGNVGGSSLFPSPQPFSYIANIASTADAAIVFPNYPTDKSGAHYDGTFDFYFEQPVSQQGITVWDGDFDFGKYDGSVNDTDDPDTPNAPFRPAWATTDTVPEGVATGLSGATGNPPDDRNPAGSGSFLQFSPSIFYDLIFPDGQSFRNDNPSGNQEWEQFNVSTDPYDPSVMDYHTDAVPPGVYRLHIQGLDMQNLNALLLPGRALCVSQTGVPCTPLHPYLLGDTVFFDENQNGVQDPGEPGIPGVTLELHDQNGYLIGTTTTDSDGHYSFEVEAESYTVVVIGGAGTAEGPSQCQATISNHNDLDCDFPYIQLNSIGDRVWSDGNGNGIQDPDEPGINYVTVNLLDADGNVISSDTTHGNGDYLFTQVPSGAYTVRIDDTSLPGGLTATYDLDGIATPNAAAVSVSGGQNRTDVDFGYQGNASLGDRVWLDNNGDGVQDPGEPGITGVTVQLYDDIGTTLLTSTVTGADGHYSFDHLAEGTYTVKIDPSTLPADATPTYDLDGTDTPNEVDFVSAPAGEPNNDVDFGYQTPNVATASIGDRIWNDVNGDGVQDAGEAGINGVAVQLLDAANNVAATATTSGDGNYSFANLAAGAYTVRIVASTLPAGVAPTYDLDGTATPNAAGVTVSQGQTRTDVDFGYQGTASVGDRIWLDADGDGVQDAGEAGINGATVQLLDFSGNVVATATTSGDGNYSFSNLNGGNYSVRVVTSSLPAGVAETYDLDGTATADVASFSLSPGDSRTDVDFGYRGTASVGDRVWLDGNGDGVQDAGEAGINGVTVQLLDSANNVAATTTTSGDGNYSFANLAAGNYSIRVTPPTGVTPTYDLDGVATANLASFALAAGAHRTDVDFGYRGTASVGDRVWLDADGDGVQDAGEAGINGVTVQLLDGANDVVAATTTSGDGNYSFGDLSGGSYTVRVSGLPAGVSETYDLDGVASANQASFTLAAGQGRTDVDFGYRYSGSVGDRVWNDDNGNGVQDAGEPGLNSVTVQLLDGAGNVVAAQTTGGDGNYSFTGLPAGSYTVRVVASSLPAGFTETYDLDGVVSANQASFTLGAGQSRTDVDFGYRMPPPNPGEDCATAAAGDPAYNQNPSGHALYMPGIGTDFIFTPAPGAFTTAADGTAHLLGTVRSASNPANAFLVDIQLSGYTGIVPAGSPKKELRPEAYIDNGGPIDPATWYYYTAFSGTLTGLGNYAGAVIDITRTGPAFQVGVGANGKNTNFGASGWFDLSIVSQPTSGGTLTPTDHGDVDVDLGDCPPATASAGDRVWSDANGNGAQDSGETGINGVTVQLLDVYGNLVATTTTGGDGNYTFANLIAGSYTVRIDAASLPAGSAETYDLDGVASANQATFNLTTGQSRTDVDFGYRGTASVGDRVWLDANGNGAQDSGETGINGVTVQLLSGSAVVATTTTSGDGNYSFSNLAPGSYTVRVSGLPAGTAESYDLDGVASANQASFNLGAGQNRTDVDFGYRYAGSVGDRIWLDSNGNGTQDSGEVGLDGFTVQLLDGANNVIASTVTSGDGNYLFGNLPPGSYSVRVINLPAGVTETYDLDGVATANFASFTLAAGQSRTDVDFGYKINGCAIAAALSTVYGPSSGGQALWLPGIVTDLVFTPNPGGFVVNSDGTAHLTGSVVSVSDPGKGFTIDVQLSGLTFSTPSGSPKKELQSSAYKENGGPVDTSTWLYFTSYTGTFTGTGSYAGAVISITRTGPAFQVGVGANGKNVNFGGSGWYNWTVTHQPYSGGNLQTTGQGDINIDLDDCGTLGSVGDRLWLDANGNGIQDSGEAGINGVTVQIMNSNGNTIAAAVTSGDGNYSFNGVPAGTYTVSVVTSTLPSGVSQTYDLDGLSTANKATFSLGAGESRADVDFGYRGSLSIGDRVWKDSDGDGNQDSGESGYSGVTVQLLSGSTVIATTTTNSNGNYSFGNLTAGTYTVKVTPPAGTTETYDLDGLSSANQATVNLTASRTDVDFGYRPAGTLSIGDRVWKDANANGQQDSGEPGLSGVTVQLLSGSTVIATTTTNSNGNYSFGSLTAGTYTVKIVSSTLGGTATETYDLDGLSSANQATVNLTASRTDVDFGYHFPVAGCDGTGTLGYWKTHSSAWPVSSITIGGVTYTKSQAISWLSASVRGDESIALFHQLVPAELNALIGNNVSCITTTIQAADDWMSQYGPVGSHVSTSSSAGHAGDALESQLDDYNNGNLSCANHR